MARLDEIAELLCVNSRWLRTGEGPKHPGVPSTSYTSRTALLEQPDAYLPGSALSYPHDVDVPFFNEVLNASNRGQTHVAQIPDYQVRLSSTIFQAMDVSPDQAICAPLTGNSMAPRIEDGSTLAIDCSLTQIVDGEIYALEHDGMLRIRYVYRQVNNGLRLRSHNHEEYPDELYSAAQILEQRIQILGWVFWWSTLNKRRPPVPLMLAE